MEKPSLDFRELFLAIGDYMQKSSYNLSSKCHFFLDLWHVRHELQTYLFDALEFISSH